MRRSHPDLTRKLRCMGPVIGPRPSGFALGCAGAVLFAAASAEAASLQAVANFGDNPTGAKMYVYVPDKPASTPPLLVALHYCTGSANAFFTGTGYRALADQHGFIVIYPEAPDHNTDKCWDVNSNASLEHGGKGDSDAIVSMVKYAVTEYGADASRVYVTGTSSGAMMTNVLLGAYPDVFKGGAVFAGVPYGCFAGPSYWNSACATGQTMKTGQAWGDLVRAAYPDYHGSRPRVQLWHGTSDQTLNFDNFGEEIKQWTNVLGVSETPTTTEQDQPQSGWTRTRYDDSCGVVRVEAVREEGQTHNLNVRADEVIRFFALDGKAPDPGAMTCGEDPPGGADGGIAGAGDAGARSIHTGDDDRDASMQIRDGSTASSAPHGSSSATASGTRDAGEHAASADAGALSGEDETVDTTRSSGGDGCGVRGADASGAGVFALLALRVAFRLRRRPRRSSAERA